MERNCIFFDKRVDCYVMPNKVKNALNRNGVTMCSELLRMDQVYYNLENEFPLSNHPYLYDILNKFKQECTILYNDYMLKFLSEDENKLAEEIYIDFTSKVNVFEEVKDAIKYFVYMTTEKDIEKEFYNNHVIVDCILESCKNKLKSKFDDGFTYEEFIQYLPSKIERDQLSIILHRFLLINNLQYKNNVIAVQKDNVNNIINNIKDIKEKEIIIDKISGVSNDKIIDKIKCSSADVFNTIKKYAKLFRNMQLEENIYLHLYENYNIPRFAFYDIFGSNNEYAYSYLECFFKKGNKNIDDALTDENINYSIKKKLELYYEKPCSALDAINKIEDDRIREFFRLRFSGATLEEIGKQSSVTRERVRQIIENNTYKVFFRTFDEDKYAYFYKTYTDTKKCLEYILKEKFSSVYYYLSLRYEKGTRSIEECLYDENIDIEFRKEIQKYLDRNYYVDGDKRVLLTKVELEKYILANYIKNDVTYSELFEIYNNFIKEHSLDESLLIKVEEHNSRSNYLASKRFLLAKQNKKIKYYDIDAYDYEELLETLDLSGFSDIELSTLFFIERYPDLMKKYNIKDEYELHNLLKKILDPKDFPNLKIGKMPTLIFGNFDRTKSLMRILNSYGTLEINEFVDIIHEKFGTRKNTALAVWLAPLNKYFHNGIYSMDYPKMDLMEIEYLKSKLTEQFYFTSEILDLYLKEFPYRDESFINPYILKQIGFNVYVDYVVRGTTSDAYFKQLLLSNDIIKYEDIKRYMYIIMFTNNLYEFRKERKLIEVSPGVFYSYRKLEEQGLTKDQMDNFSQKVYDFVGNEMFTMNSLRLKGFDETINGINDDYLYSTIIRDSSLFHYAKFGKNTIFSKDQVVTRQSFLVEVIENANKIQVDELIKILNKYYDVELDSSTILTSIHESEIYYDYITKTCYKDYLEFEMDDED